MTNTGCASVDLAIVRKKPKLTFSTQISISHVTTVKRLKEIILEQLGKTIVSFRLGFDVGYAVGQNKICFSKSDDLKTELGKTVKKGILYGVRDWMKHKSGHMNLTV